MKEDGRPKDLPKEAVAQSKGGNCVHTGQGQGRTNMDVTHLQLHPRNQRALKRNPRGK